MDSNCYWHGDIDGEPSATNSEPASFPPPNASGTELAERIERLPDSWRVALLRFVEAAESSKAPPGFFAMAAPVASSLNSCDIEPDRDVVCGDVLENCAMKKKKQH